MNESVDDDSDKKAVNFVQILKQLKDELKVVKEKHDQIYNDLMAVKAEAIAKINSEAAHQKVIDETDAAAAQEQTIDL